jgi:hypothetical protein
MQKVSNCLDGNPGMRTGAGNAIVECEMTKFGTICEDCKGCQRVGISGTGFSEGSARGFGTC